ncbi:double-strand break repair protein AddB [Rhizobium sp. Leaf384]|uniref:double-strand break repair protein AddB n=1 Tax=unclassified Rhizobium TaxID=2613769 RepID=UPI000712AEF6|nr:MULTISPECIES: double-strand break repair protein AddB [unclassified Rhizobium]KQS76082.1 double-strand break repair protein AddB [Rhizobium sp. Leaf384]KQS85827.1 double-strand break repair protein AddB [Rhizobium sp. Leaf383]
MTPARQNVLTIPAGVPFLKTLVHAICDGTVVPDYRYDPTDPLSLAGVTIFVPTRRAARVLRSEFVDCLGARSAILPVIRALGETDDDSGFFDAEIPAVLDLAPPLTGPARLIELSRLILAWRNTLPRIVTELHGDSPLIAPASPADALWLARNLVQIIDDIETEDLDWTSLSSLDASNYAQWWTLTLEFLEIASQFWPARLTELSRSSPARHRNAVLEAESHRIAAGAIDGPIIIAGSTGSIPATARLILAVQKLAQGAIVLPGLDGTMTEPDWNLIDPPLMDTARRDDSASRSHPQYGFVRLLRRMGISRSEVISIGTVENDLADRAETLSHAFLPVEATSSWDRVRRSLDARRVEAAFADAALIEAVNEREEATAIALSLRLALQKDEECQAALITPDRDLARRVAAELQRFGIEADDSAGTPLASTPQGTLLRLMLDVALRPGDPVAITTLIKHPLARFGLSAERFRPAATLLELLALRGGTAPADIADLRPLLDEAALSRRADRHAPEWLTQVTDADIEEVRFAAGAIAAAVEPLVSMLVRRRKGSGGFSTSLTLAEWAERTGRALEGIAMTETSDLGALWSGEAGEALADLLRAVIEADGQIEADGGQWCEAVEALMAGSAVKPRAMRHPRVFIFGALEARLQSVDLVVLGGMNEGTWPGQTANDPFLSRSMKTGIGLEPPERRIGQLAHDLQMACGTRRLVFSRSLRKGATPTVASRWLQRLLAVGGKDLGQRLRENGRDRLRYAALLDARPDTPLARRPEPKPDFALQPQRYSFSEVGRLRRDPYSVYARRILRLQPVDGFNADPGAAERGTIYHAIVERFAKSDVDPASPEASMIMTKLIDEAFDEQHLPVHIDVIWRPRFAAVGRAFIDWEISRKDNIRQSFLERYARFKVGVADIELTGIADRIDIGPDGAAVIVDYKTGASPSVREARALLDPQLPLEAAALKAGAFKEVGKRHPSSLLYVRLKPGDRFDVDEVNNEGRAKGDVEPKTAEMLADESLAQFTGLLRALQVGQRGFASRVIVQKEKSYGGEYDHLARVAEWSTADGEEETGDA